MVWDGCIADRLNRGAMENEDWKRRWRRVNQSNVFGYFVNQFGSASSGHKNVSFREICRWGSGDLLTD